MAVVGFDDLSLCNCMEPPLTTVHVPTQIMGETAVSRLAEMAEKKDSHTIKIEISAMLRKRKSV